MGKVYIAKNIQKKSVRIDSDGKIIGEQGDATPEETQAPKIQKTSVRLNGTPK